MFYTCNVDSDTDRKWAVLYVVRRIPVCVLREREIGIKRAFVKNTWKRKRLRKTVVVLQNKEQLFVSKIYLFICYLYVFKLFCVCSKRYRYRTRFFISLIYEIGESIRLRKATILNNYCEESTYLEYRKTIISKLVCHLLENDAPETGSGKRIFANNPI